MSRDVHRTAVFTIHNPTHHVRAVFDYALVSYTRAYTVALRLFAPYTVQELHAMAASFTDDTGAIHTSDKRLSQRLFARSSPALDEALAPLEGGMRESLKRHVAETLLSYVELSLGDKQAPSYPSRLRKQDIETIRQMTLAEIAALSDDLEQEQSLFALLQRTRMAEVVPVEFCRIDAERNCGLFYQQDQQKFYARLFLLPQGSRFAAPLVRRGQYIDIRSGEVYAREEDAQGVQGVKSFGSGKRSIMVPLEMGDWHEEMLRFTQYAFLPQRTKKGEPAVPVAARLLKYQDDYQLHVMFKFPKPTRLNPLTLLGVDRGINCLAAGTVTALDGHKIIETFKTDGTELRRVQQYIEQNIRTRQAKGRVAKGDKRRGRIADAHVHLCANQIVELAIKHQSQVVMEDLSAFAAPHKHQKGKTRSNFNAMLPRRQYQKLLSVIDAKLELAGLPPVRIVSAWHTSLTCSQCGNISKESRSEEDRTQFKCIACGFEAHADVQAGVNIARKLLWLKLRSEEKRKELPVNKRTSWAAFAKSFRIPMLIKE
jgi:IS605 OrfB family transposase